MHRSVLVALAFAASSCRSHLPTVTPTEAPAVVSQGVSVAYDVTGAGEPLVLLHGLTLDRRMWDPNLAALAREYRVIRIDLPGAGRSSEPTGPTSFSQVVSDVLAAAGVQRADIIGLSNGGEIAVNLAIEHPALVKSLVLVDASLNGFPYSREFLSLFQRYFATAQREGVPQANKLWLEDPLFVPARRDTALARQLRDIVLPYTGEAWLHFAWRSGPRPTAISRLSTIQVPTLVIVGELDVPDMQRIADTLAARIPNARRLTLQGVGHMSNMESPTRFNQAVLEFLRTVH